MKVLALVLAGCLSMAPLSAAEVRVFCAGAVEPGLVALSDAFTRETVNVVRLRAGVLGALRQKVEAGEAPDVLIAPPPVMDALVQVDKVYHLLAASLLLGEGQALRDGAQDFRKFLVGALYVQRWLLPRDLHTPPFAARDLVWLDALIGWTPVPKLALGSRAFQ